jgi:carbon monoxide dehydrogenase subunit G
MEMRLEHEFTIPLPIDQAWSALLDVQRIAPCLPGATVERVEGDDVEGRVAATVGPISLSYHGIARFREKDEASRRFVFEGHGRETRGAGTATGTITGQLHDEGSSTRVVINTDLDITGKPAQFGRGVVADVAGNLIGQFASCLADQFVAQPTGDGVRGSDAVSESGLDNSTRSASTSDSVNVLAALGPVVRKRLIPALLAIAALLAGWLLTRRRSPTVVVHLHISPPRRLPPAT